MAARSAYVLVGATVVLLVAGAGFIALRKPGPGAIPPAAPAPNLLAEKTASVPQADCLLPGPPPVTPNGALASAGDMLLGRKVIQAFVEQLEAYQACRNAQADHAAPGVTAQQKQIWIEQGNEAVDQANAMAMSFRDQLKLFKDRTGAK